MVERIIIADDHPIFRDGMCRLIGAALPKAQLCEAGSIAEVLATVNASGSPDLFVLDLLFPGMDVRETLPALRQKCPKSSIIIVSMLDDDATINRVLKQGADAYIVKSLPASEMLEAVMAVREGKFVVARPNIAAMTDPLPIAADIMELTQRQREILSLIHKRRSNKEIGRELGLSHFTIRNHISLMMRIMNVQSRSELTNKMLEFRD
jgi:DNA-binding NarL/FixJ family response regulator